MITTNLTGNFGDHIVRYSLARMVAEENNYQWAINPVPSHDYFGGQSQLYFFDLDYGLPNDTPYGQLPPGIEHEWEESCYIYPTRRFYYFQEDVFDVPDNTNLKIYCGQDARYYDRDKLLKWFEIKAERQDLYKRKINLYDIDLEDDNLTVINCRGGEYKGVQDLFLKPIYYERAIDFLLSGNPKMKFIVITDDVAHFKAVFDFPVYHFGISTDYYVLNNAKSLIISNSGFALFPVWLNQNKPMVIAPKYWARHNIGLWANSNVWTFGENDNWLFLDHEGNFASVREITNG